MRRPRHRLIMGRHCIEEVLRHAPDRLVGVYTTKEQDPLLKQLERRRIPIEQVSKRELSQMVNSDSHQSFAAEVHEKSSRPLKEFLNEEKEQSLVIALDNINDPHNLGAILRAAECFGADAIVYSKNRGSDITPTVSKVSVGATELVEIFKISNLAETVKKFYDAGYRIVATALTAEAQSLTSYDFSPKTLLIMGSEAHGIQKLIMRYVEDCVMIPMLGKIDSLNVSQATAVILSHYRQSLLNP